MADNPLSPHLQVYRPQLTSVLSITHRGTGVFLSLGTIVMLYWLVSASLGPDAYASMQQCLSSMPIQIVLAGWVFAFYFHLLNGVRHLFWDSGRGFELSTAYKSGYAVMAGALLMSALTWGCVISQGGAA